MPKPNEDNKNLSTHFSFSEHHFSEQTKALSERQSLLSHLPVFAKFSTAELSVLAELLTEVKVDSGEIIVEEDALIDSVYIIAKGRAEVTKRRRIKSATRYPTPVAVREQGDAIGLNDTGFFSASGKRTATVTALTPTVLLKLDLRTLHQFLKLYPHLQPVMYSASGEMLKMRLIKQSLPFSKLSYRRLRFLADQVQELFVPKGATIFKEGEMGESCYLIRAGKVEIIKKEEDNNKQHVAILKTPTLFGEATLITNSPRNATAIALEDCELLVLRHEHLTELLENENQVAKMFMNLMVDRSRPKRNSFVTAHPRKTKSGEKLIILKNSLTGHYFQLSKEGWFVWKQLSGKQSMQNITIALAERYHAFMPDKVAALISKLAKAGFVTNVQTQVVHAESEPDSPWMRSFLQLRKIFEYRFAFANADKKLSQYYQHFFYLLNTLFGKFVLISMIVCGFILFLKEAKPIIHLVTQLKMSWILLLILIPITMLTVVFHELGHAIATKSYGNEVHFMGVGWNWVTPIAFTDTSDMWLSERWPRIIVNLAGIYADLIVAGLSATLAFFITLPYLKVFLWLFASFTYINALRMISPLQELDGYYVLVDIFERPHLRRSAIHWLLKDAKHTFYQVPLIKKYYAEITYWFISVIFLALVSAITIYGMRFLFGMFGHTTNIWISLLAPLTVIVITIFAVMREAWREE